MQLSRVHYPVLTLGHGRRAGVWTQGCSLHCPGCVALDTWAPDPTSEVPVAEILRWLAERPPLDGVTVSGGEPLDQADELYELLRGVRALFPVGVDLLCYTGRTRGAVEKAFAPLLGLADAIIVGPFQQDRPTRRPLMGSANQELVPLTSLGRERYGDWPEDQGRMVQASVQDGQVWTVGIPLPGQLDQLEAAAAERRVDLFAQSWRAEP
ncbi:MAG: radical SAM protein [Propionibacteriaceae bacterium]|jgi:anaerobic ribonucleoside-triphosphate reductase activating protein|nr:radical SAM protein [Propionibacteriaceae bacterium]